LCEKCDRTVELIEQTLEDRTAVVSFSFPNGEPKLVRHVHTTCGDPDCYQAEHIPVLARAVETDSLCRNPKCYFPDEWRIDG